MKINRVRPDVHEEDVAMMSTPISWASWGEEADGPCDGWTSTDDRATPDVYYRKGGRDEVLPLP